MSEYNIRFTEAEDVAIIASSVRQADAEELWASYHLTPAQALKLSYTVLRNTCFTGTADGEPVCMFGVKEPSMLGNVACPWMIASNRLEFYSRPFLRMSKRLVQEVWRKEFPVMQNFVDERNVVAVRWLQWVGFSVYYPKPYGMDNLPFHRFEMRTE